MLDPESWDVRNDSHYLALYRDGKKLRSVLALCFTEAHETYHHWRVFAAGPSGVCIRFKRSKLLRVFDNYSGFRTRAIRYLTRNEMSSRNHSIQDLPFLKRKAFSNEKEFRVIYESKDKKYQKLEIGISLSCIEGITLSPWMPRALYAHVRDAILAIDGCERLDIVRSTLISNEEWKNSGEAAAKRLGPV